MAVHSLVRNVLGLNMVPVLGVTVLVALDASDGGILVAVLAV